MECRCKKELADIRVHARASVHKTRQLMQFQSRSTRNANSQKGGLVHKDKAQGWLNLEASLVPCPYRWLHARLHCVRIGTCSLRQHLRSRQPPLVFPHVPRSQEGLVKNDRERARAKEQERERETVMQDLHRYLRARALFSFRFTCACADTTFCCVKVCKFECFPRA